MSSPAIACLVLLGLLLLLMLRVPIAIALCTAALAGIAILRGPATAWGVLAELPYESAAHWSLSAVPMFLLMGAASLHGGLTGSLFETMRLWLGRLPGGLAVATNVACTMFAAASGSSVATSAAMAPLAVPEMLKHRYQPALATSVVAASGTIGAMIPPSLAFVIYGWYTGAPIGKLLIAGIIPGLLTAAVYTAMIMGRVMADPTLAPKPAERYSLAEKLASLRSIWPVPLLIVSVMGSIYTGIATATEAAALGAVTALLICLFRGTLSVKMLHGTFADTLKSTAAIFIIAIGAGLLAKFLALSGLPAFLASYVDATAPHPAVVIGFMLVLYLVLGVFLDPIGIILITLPVLMPMFKVVQLDLIWMGVLVVKMIEIGLLTPPVGLNVFVVKAAVGDRVALSTIFRGVGWFLAAEVVIVALLLAFPQISLYLPSLME